MRASSSSTSGKQVFDDLAVNIRQPEAAALKLVRQSQVIDTRGMQKRRLQVVNVHRLLATL